MISPFFIFSQVIADFTSSVVSGCVGTQVEFTDISHGNPTYWQWDFGNGVVSNIQHPIVTFTDPGFYDVKLYATNNVTGDMIIKDAYVSIYDCNPNLDF